VIVGYTFTNGGDEIRGFVSNQGQGMVDLNTVIDNPGDAYVLAAYYVNNSGEIVGIAQFSSGEIHPVVLVPDTALDSLAKLKAATVSHRSAPAAGAASQVKHSRRPGYVSVCGAGRMASRSCAER
jgi:hypothetical protein